MIDIHAGLPLAQMEATDPRPDRRRLPDSISQHRCVIWRPSGYRTSALSAHSSFDVLMTATLHSQPTANLASGAGFLWHELKLAQSGKKLRA